MEDDTILGMPTTDQPATKQPSTQPLPHPLCDNFTCVIHYPLFDGVRVVADKKKGAYLVIGISGEAELLSATCTGLQEFQSDQGAIDWVAKKRRN